jgi:Ulp1 family protease
MSCTHISPILLGAPTELEFPFVGWKREGQSLAAKFEHLLQPGLFLRSTQGTNKLGYSVRSLQTRHAATEQVVEAYFDSMQTGKYEKTLYFHRPQFMRQFVEADYDYSRVESKNSNVRMAKTDMIFFPIRVVADHWALAILYPKETRIEYYDCHADRKHCYPAKSTEATMQTKYTSDESHSHVRVCLASYMRDELKKRGEIDLDISNVDLEVIQVFQQNRRQCNVDSAIWIMTWAAQIANGETTQNSARNTKELRVSIAVELAEKSVQHQPFDAKAAMKAEPKLVKMMVDGEPCDVWRLQNLVSSESECEDVSEVEEQQWENDNMEDFLADDEIEPAAKSPKEYDGSEEEDEDAVWHPRKKPKRGSFSTFVPQLSGYQIPNPNKVTCYVNASMQLVASVLVRAEVNWDHVHSDVTKLVRELLKATPDPGTLVSAARVLQKRFLKDDSLLKVKQDATDFLRCVLVEMLDNLNVSQLWTIEKVAINTCDVCKGVSVSPPLETPMLRISLPKPDKGCELQPSQRNHLVLTSLLKSHWRPRRADANTKCGQCKKAEGCDRADGVPTNLPQYVFILLERLYGSEVNNATKIETAVNYPDKLDIGSLSTGTPMIYDLHAVLRHHTSPAHCTAEVRQSNGSWMYLNDSPNGTENSKGLRTPTATRAEPGTEWVLVYHKRKEAITIDEDDNAIRQEKEIFTCGECTTNSANALAAAVMEGTKISIPGLGNETHLECLFNKTTGIGAFLNDSVIHFWLNQIRSRLKDPNSVCVLEPGMFGGYQTGQLTTTKNAYEKRKKNSRLIVIPLHRYPLWMLGVIDTVESQYAIFDSHTVQNEKKMTEDFRQFVAHVVPDFSKWTELTGKDEVFSALQKNGKDCGLFLCKTAEAVLTEHEDGRDWWKCAQSGFAQREVSMMRMNLLRDIIQAAKDNESREQQRDADCVPSTPETPIYEEEDPEEEGETHTHTLNERYGE